MIIDSHFLSHLRLSSERVKDWPSWKTDMWKTENKNYQGHNTTQTTPILFTLYRTVKK